jgi:hypothetical protein
LYERFNRDCFPSFYFSVEDTGLVSQLLRNYAAEVSETRKGRYWEFTDSGSLASLTVLKTADNAEFEDELLNAGYLPEDVPEALVIAYPSKDNRDACIQLAQLMVTELSGITLKNA